MSMHVYTIQNQKYTCRDVDTKIHPFTDTPRFEKNVLSTLKT